MIFLSWQLKVLQTWQNWLLNQSKGRQGMEFSCMHLWCYTLCVLQGRKWNAWAIGKENPERKKKKGYLGISFSVTSYSMFTFLFFSISYFFMGSVPSPADPPKSTMPLSCIVRVVLRVRQLQNIKGKKESPSTPSSFLKKAIDVAWSSSYEAQLYHISFKCQKLE